MAYLNKSDFLKRGKERKYKTVHIPDLGGDVVIRSLTSSERDDFERESVSTEGNKTEIRENIRARLVSKAVVHPETHEPWFNELEVRELGQVRSGIMDLLYTEARDLSDVSDEDIEDMVKASESAPSPDSGIE